MKKKKKSKTSSRKNKIHQKYIICRRRIIKTATISRVNNIYSKRKFNVTSVTVVKSTEITHRKYIKKQQHQHHYLLNKVLKSIKLFGVSV